jgi:LmbE family N-acetylglucosaminyl deacetylase
LNILAFFAHPDDETVLAGGCLAILAKLGHNVHFLIATRGEGGETGIPPICTRQELGFFRENELRNAVNLLGGTSLTILNYVDPVVGPENILYPFSDNPKEVLSQLVEVVSEKSINIIISHGSNGEYGHPAHKLVFQIVKKFFKKPEGQILWYTVQAEYSHALKPHLLNHDDPADWVMDTTLVRQQKLLATKAHKTQHALFLRRKSKELGRLAAIEEIIVNEESYHLAFGTRDILFELLNENGLILKKGSMSS